jgi:hypothetical protein
MKIPLTFLLALTFYYPNRRGAMRTIILVFLFSLLSITPVNALTGQEWISQCDSTYDEISESECISYLDGLGDMLSIIHKRYYMEEHGKYRLLPKLCFPPRMTLGQVQKIMLKYLNEYPEKLHSEFADLYLVQMSITFNCSKEVPL